MVHCVGTGCLPPPPCKKKERCAGFKWHAPIWERIPLFSWPYRHSTRKTILCCTKNVDTCCTSIVFVTARHGARERACYWSCQNKSLNVLLASFIGLFIGIPSYSMVPQLATDCMMLCHVFWFRYDLLVCNFNITNFQLPCSYLALWLCRLVTLPCN